MFLNKSRLQQTVLLLQQSQNQTRCLQILPQIRYDVPWMQYIKIIVLNTHHLDSVRSNCCKILKTFKYLQQKYILKSEIQILNTFFADKIVTHTCICIIPQVESKNKKEI
jgi:hypothetical protein